jgi:transposase
MRAKAQSNDFVEFLEYLLNELPKDKEIHIIFDNYATHKTALVK